VTAGPAAAGHRRLRVGGCLSLTGRYARFGRQAARGLDVWRSLDRGSDLIVADDRSDPRTLAHALPRVAAQCDVLLGPYSTRLTREAGRLAARAGWLLWNHGGSGDDVEAAYPGHMVSVLAPASRYAEPFVRHLSAAPDGVPLWIAHGRGSFGRQVATGAEASARRAGLETASLGPGDRLPTAPPARWDLFSAGSFDEDVALIRRARAARVPPRLVCAVAAGVREFGAAAGDAMGTFGVGQWFPGAERAPGLEAETDPGLGPAEADFLAAYFALTGTAPDYPAVQAAAAAVLAVHCARRAGGNSRDLLWDAALALDTQTLFGDFRIRAADGVQVGHQTVLVRWTAEGPVLVRAGEAGEASA
jgi:ABC-type branched-subunit amino acid transport system substrate-binding protein